MRPRLLVVSPRFLFPLDQGGRIRTVNTLRRLKGGLFDTILASPAPASAASRLDGMRGTQPPLPIAGYRAPPL